MKIIQSGSRTVRVQAEGGSLALPYRMYWNGHEREPESIVLEGKDVRAFFLFGTIRDRISEDKTGLHIFRTWTVMTPGTVRLSIDTDFEAGGSEVTWLFPGSLAEQEGAPEQAVLGEKTALPSSVFIFTSTRGILVFSSLPEGDKEAASIGVRRIEPDEEPPFIRAELRIPPADGPRAEVGPKPLHVEQVPERDITSSGSLEWTETLHVVFAPRDSIVLKGTSLACTTLMVRDESTEAAVQPEPALAVKGSLETHLFAEGGVIGLRELPDSPFLSASAGASCCVLIHELFPDDAGLCETALRLADFCLKGQHPSGLFFETFSIERGEWQGVRGKSVSRGFFKPVANPLVSIAVSARIAERLLTLSRLLEAKGLPGRKYFLAGLRFVEFFLDERGILTLPGALHAPGDREPAEMSLAGFETFFPTAEVFSVTKQDRYKKALDGLAKAFGAVPWEVSRPASSRQGRDPDAQAALSSGRLAVEMRRLGYAPGRPEIFLSLLAPWVHVNRSGRKGPLDALGGLTDSFRRQRLLFAGAETAWVLAALGEHIQQKWVRDIARELAHLSLRFSHQAPPGTAFFQHTRWDGGGKLRDSETRTVGPVDSRRLMREAEFGMRLIAEFPGLVLV